MQPGNCSLPLRWGLYPSEMMAIQADLWRESGLVFEVGASFRCIRRDVHRCCLDDPGRRAYGFNDPCECVRTDGAYVRSWSAFGLPRAPFGTFSPNELH